MHDGQQDDRDAGFTLIELLAVSVIAVLLVGTLSATLILLVRDRGNAAQRLDESRGAQTLAAFLQADVNSTPFDGGAFDDDPFPSTCGGQTLPGSNVLTLAWREQSDTYGTIAATASYRLESRKDGVFELVRTLCENDVLTRGSLVVAPALTADADADATTDPQLITMNLATKPGNSGRVYRYRVVATRKNANTTLCNGSVTLAATVIARDDDRYLTQPARIESLTTTGSCTGRFRADYFAGGASRQVEFTTTDLPFDFAAAGGPIEWELGPVVVNVRQVLSGGTPGPTVGLASFTVTGGSSCVVSPVTVTPSSVALTSAASQTLSSSFTVSATSTPGCPVGALRLSVFPGVPDSLASTGPLTMALVAGSTYQLEIGPAQGILWSSGTRDIEVQDAGGTPRATTSVEVTDPVVAPSCGASLALDTPAPPVVELTALREGYVSASLGLSAVETSGNCTDLSVRVDTGVVEYEQQMTESPPGSWAVSVAPGAALWSSASPTKTLRLIDRTTGAELDTATIDVVNPCAATIAALSVNENIILTAASQLAESVQVRVTTAGSCGAPDSGTTSATGYTGAAIRVERTSGSTPMQLEAVDLSDPSLPQFRWFYTYEANRDIWAEGEHVIHFLDTDGNRVVNGSGGGDATVTLRTAVPLCQVSSVTITPSPVVLKAGSNQIDNGPLQIAVVAPEDPCGGIEISFDVNPSCPVGPPMMSFSSGAWRCTIADKTKWNTSSTSIEWTVRIGSGRPLYSGSLPVNRT